MSRPTNEHKLEQAEQWMVHTFGHKMRDYVEMQLREPLSVAIVEVDRLFKLAGVQSLLTQWREEDVKSNAGAKPHINNTAALAMILVQLRIGRHTLLTDMTRTFFNMSPRQREVLGINHDGNDGAVYDRLLAAVHRVIALVDEFPGRRDKILTGAEYAEVVRRRDPVKCRQRRERMFILGNALVEATWRMLPQEVRDRWEGNCSQDATKVELQGKRGNPSAKTVNRKRRSINHDGGYYGRSGDHEAHSLEDALALNLANPDAKVSGSPTSKLTWAVEAELVRLVPNLDAEADLFPLLTIGLSYHIPGSIAGEAVRLLKSLSERGHQVNYCIYDRAYPGGKLFEFQVPARRLGAKLVFDYKAENLGVQYHFPEGFLQVSGSLYLDNLPQVLRDMDAVFEAAEKKHEQAMSKIDNAEGLSDPERTKARQEADRAFRPARDLYTQQLEQRAKYQLLRKGQMDRADGTRRYLVPTDAPGYAKWKSKPGSHQGKTFGLKLPTLDEANEDKNAGGLKMEQHFAYGTPQWRTTYALRNGIESANRNIKRGQFESLANPDKRSVRGNTFTYIVIAMAVVSENLRQIVSFLKRRLAVRPFTPKNQDAPSNFWQSASTPVTLDPGAQPPS